MLSYSTNGLKLAAAAFAALVTEAVHIHLVGEEVRDTPLVRSAEAAEEMAFK